MSTRRALSTLAVAWGRRPLRRAASLFLTLLPNLVAASALAQVSTAGILPPGRQTVWSPGIPGGVPARTIVCVIVNASTYGNGSSDATTGIQAAIDACPAGQVVQLSAGDFLVNGAYPITINKGIVLRGAGPRATKLRKTSTSQSPLIVVGERWPQEAASVNLTANVAKGATSVQVSSSSGFSAGQLVLLDELTDTSYVSWGSNCPLGDACRTWFTRPNRPIGQMLEISAINGNTVSFTTPLHIAFDTAHQAQLTRFANPYGAKYAGLEDLYVRGGQDDNITVRFAMYSWVKNVESDWSTGDSVALDSCFRCVLRDSYVHDTPFPQPGGAGYMLSVGEYTSDSLIENNIFINGNKVMVMRASGGGNVIGYNYFDNGYIDYNTGWVETGMNAGHMACPHFELFEGNQAFNIDGDNTWGGAVYITYFRNHATGKRRSFEDIQNRRAIGLMYGHYNYSFVGNVLGTANQDPSPYGSFAKEDFYPWGDDPVAMWRIGYNPEDWNEAEARVVNTIHRHGNFDYATSTVEWAGGYAQTLPASLYLASKPAFFGANPWPWVDPTGATKLYTLPARARYDAGNPPLLPVLSINDVTVTEGNSGTVNASFTVTLSAASSQTATVNYATAANTATAGSDYVTQSGSLTFAAGQTTKTIAVVVNGDTTGEADETFWVNLSAPANATLADPQAVGTIGNDDSPALSLSINDVTVTEGNSGTVNATFTVTLSAAGSQTVTVSYATANGSATASGSDYVAQAGSLSFAAGQRTKTVAVVVKGDTTVEPNESFFVNLSSPTNATLADSQGQGTINNDDSAPLPTVSINDVTVTEGNSGTVNATFTVTLSAASSQTVTVSFATANGSAAGGSDYVAQSGSLSFAAGQTTKTVAVIVKGDTTVEPNETFFVNLSSPTNAALADSQGQGTINNDDTGGILTMGETSILPINDSDNGNLLLAQQATLSQTATIQSLSFYVTTAAGKLRLGVYDATGPGGGPGAKKAEAGEITPVGGWNTANVTSPVSLPAGTYWLAYLPSDYGLGFRNAQTGSAKYYSLAYGPLPAKFSTTPKTATAHWSFYATLNISAPPPPSVAEAVVWTSALGVSVSSNNLTKTAATGWNNAGAVSSKSLASGDGYVEFTASETTTYRMLGLSNGNSNQNWDDIDFALYPMVGAQIRVYEKGVLRGSFGTYAAGDKLRVAVVSGVVKYSRNGTVFYTSPLAPTYPLLVDTALYTNSASLNGAVISGSWR